MPVRPAPGARPVTNYCPQHSRNEDCVLSKPPEIDVASPMELLIELRALIERCLDHKECYFIVESEAVHRYVQGLVHQDQSLVTESVSNISLGHDCSREHGLGALEEAHLEYQGWRPPGAASPNWSRRFDFGWNSPSAAAAELLVRALVEVHRAPMTSLSLDVGYTACSEHQRLPVA